MLQDGFYHFSGSLGLAQTAADENGLHLGQTLPDLQEGLGAELSACLRQRENHRFIQFDGFNCVNTLGNTQIRPAHLRERIKEIYQKALQRNS